MNKSRKILTSHFSKDFFLGITTPVSQILKEELVLWQSLSSPTRTFNAVKIGGIQGSYYLLAGERLASCPFLGKRCQRRATIAN